MIHTIELNFQDLQQAIAAFLIETHKGLVLIETGPHSTLPHLVQGIRNCGFQPEDVKHVLLSHIHLDHAGAAWYFADAGAQVYVHPVGLPHLIGPERLMFSATRIYGDDMDRLWGEMRPIAPEQLIGVDDEQICSIGQYQFTALHTPGHAIHHVAWQFEDFLFTGDVAGVKIDRGPVMPPCPPPDIDISDWLDSIQRIRDINPQALFLTHFGRIDTISQHLDELTECLDNWSRWIKKHYLEGDSMDDMLALFQEFVGNQLAAKGLNNQQIAVYEAANPSWMSVYGLVRYWKKQLPQ